MNNRLIEGSGRSRPFRHGEALEGLGDAGQWVLDMMRGWLRRGRAVTSSLGSASAHCATSRSPAPTRSI